MALQIIHILAEQNCHCGIKAITDSALHAERAISAPNTERTSGAAPSGGAGGSR